MSALGNRKRRRPLGRPRLPGAGSTNPWPDRPSRTASRSSCWKSQAPACRKTRQTPVGESARTGFPVRPRVRPTRSRNASRTTQRPRSERWARNGPVLSRERSAYRASLPASRRARQSRPSLPGTGSRERHPARLLAPARNPRALATRSRRPSPSDTRIRRIRTRSRPGASSSSRLRRCRPEGRTPSSRTVPSPDSADRLQSSLARCPSGRRTGSPCASCGIRVLAAPRQRLAHRPRPIGRTLRPRSHTPRCRSAGLASRRRGPAGGPCPGPAATLSTAPIRSGSAGPRFRRAPLGQD